MNSRFFREALVDSPVWVEKMGFAGDITGTPGVQIPLPAFRPNPLT